MDELCHRGTHFPNAFVATSICSPSRAAMLTGRYGRANGVVTIGHPKLSKDKTTFVQELKQKDYKTGVVGKWHLGTPPDSCGFDHFSCFYSNGSYYHREVSENGQKREINHY